MNDLKGIDTNTLVKDNQSFLNLEDYDGMNI